MAHTIVVSQKSPVIQIKRKRKKEILFYKLACFIYSLFVIIFLIFLIIRSFRHKYYGDDGKCIRIWTWVDSAISILTLIIVVMASAIIVASFRYVLAKPVQVADDKLLSVINPTEDFIRRNSQRPSTEEVKVVVKNPTVGSDSWLTAVRNEAYEEHHRRQSIMYHNNTNHVNHQPNHLTVPTPTVSNPI